MVDKVAFHAHMIEKPKWITDLGTYNTLPTPWHEYDMRDAGEQHAFWRAFNDYTPEFIEHRSVLWTPVPVRVKGTRRQRADKREFYHSITIYWFHNWAVGVMAPHNWTIRNDGRSVHLEKPHYFRFGCEHSFKELSPEACATRGINHLGRCWHVYECAKCLTTEAHDSSD